MYKEKLMKKRQLITDVQNLDMNSKIEFFNYMVSYDIAYMENTNGIFFTIADISEELLDKLTEKLELLQKFQINKKHSDVLLLSNDFESITSNNKDTTVQTSLENNNVSNTEIKPNTSQKEVFTKVVINEYNEILKDMENRNNKMNKKHSIYIKYSIAKKKYNKQLGLNQLDNKKIENLYLNELEEENYIL